MTAAELLDRLDRVKRSGDGWAARCPAHDDRNPSLTVAEGDDGRVLVRCQAGCTSEAIVAALGLELRDLFAEERAGANGSRRIVARYPYLDETGALLFEAVRFEPKGFAQRRPDGSGGWEWNLRGIRRVLYRTPELRAALERGENVVYVVEGEKDADAIAAVGGVATTCPMGAGKWRPEYAEQLRGFEVAVVVADRDEAGIAHARQVANAIAGSVFSVELVQAAEGKDAADHLAAGHGLEGFVPLGQDAGASGPEAEPIVLRGLTHREALETEIPPVSHLVEDLIDTGTVGVIAGLPFARKTFAAHEVFYKVAAGGGRVFGRFPVAKSGPVVVVWQDDSDHNELARIQDYARRHDYGPDLPIRWLLNQGVRLPDHNAVLAELVRAEGAVLLGLDSLYNLLSPEVGLKEENVAVVLAQIKAEIADTTGCTVLIVDHAPWPTEGNRGQRRAYGSVFKTAAVRWSIHLEADAKDDTQLHVEARGNNVAGFRRTPATFDPDTHEIRLLDVKPETAAEETDALVWIAAHVAERHAATSTGVPRGKVETAYHEAHGNRGRNLARRIIDRQIDAWNEHISAGGTGENPPTLAVGPGETKGGTYLYPFAHAPSPLAAPPSGESGENPSNTLQEDTSRQLAAHPKGGEHRAARGSEGGGDHTPSAPAGTDETSSARAREDDLDLDEPEDDRDAPGPVDAAPGEDEEAVG